MAEGFQLNVRSNVKDVTRYLTAVQKRQVPFATSLAINRTAQDVRDGMRDEMKNVFDRPTPWTLNSIFIKPSTKHKLTARVWLKDFAPKGTPAVKYLRPQIFGGQRQQKRSEQAMSVRGRIGSNQYLVPTSAMRLDQYGNVTKGLMTKILSDIRASRDVSSDIQDERKLKYFLVAERKGGLSPGIYQRMAGRRIKKIFHLTNKASYRPRLDWYGVANKIASRRFDIRFRNALRNALKSVRPPRVIAVGGAG